MILSVIETMGVIVRCGLTIAIFWWLYHTQRYEWLLFGASLLAFAEAFRDGMVRWYRRLREEHDRNFVRRFDARFYRGGEKP